MYTGKQVKIVLILCGGFLKETGDGCYNTIINTA